MTALIIVDLQNDFLPGGSLAVTDGNDVIPIIQDLADSGKYTFVVATKDSHPLDHTSFASNHGVEPFTFIPFKNPNTDDQVSHTVWPVHCVEGTSGADYPPSFDPSNVQALVRKGYLQDREYYSGFEDVWGIHKTELHDLLQSKGIKEVDVVGLAYDYCVFNTAKDSAKRGYKTRIIRKATKPVDPSSEEKIIASLEEAGVSII
ncbi:Nicotinamidase [Yarrowia sp. C11]|nr:Nicotinamidase [Yarrowia sp. E02]KAG5369942.1 Nicotinamidase [Yarrowia sp. C11]